VDASAWSRIYDLLPNALKSPFFSDAYYHSYKVVELGTVECFGTYQDERNFLFYPYIRRSINSLGYDLDKEYFDLSGAYGYNGPIGIVEDAQFLHKYNTALQDHLRESNVVSQFDAMHTV